MTDDPEQDARSLEVLSGARELEGDARTRYLDEACRGDEALRARVLELLAASTDSPTGAEDVVADSNLASAPQSLDELIANSEAAWIPERIGDYEVLRQIGSGGMGVVYEAQQSSPRRRVALKVLGPMHATADGLRRFQREAEVLGHLQHPGIAQIFEASTFDAGHGHQPYFAMELVDGLSITDYANQNGLDTTERLTLVAELCDVIQYAHERGVIHRDLKPANLLVSSRSTTRSDSATGSRSSATARLKVLDFGVARAVDHDLTANTLQTTTGQIIGTIAYMSPEQASGDPDAVDFRSDVYSLGVLAYELLAHALPIPSQGLMLHDAVRAIREKEPTSLGAINRQLKGDVETIVGKALEKDRERRYATAADMAADIRRHLAHEPIQASPPSTLYQLIKFTRRNKTLVGGVVATLLVAIVGTAISLTYALDSQRRADELEWVAQFHASQWALIDLGDMAARLKQSTVEHVLAERTSTGADPAEAATTAELERLLEATDFAAVTMRFLDETLFATGQATLDEQLQDLPLVQARLLEMLSLTMLRLGLVHESVSLQERAYALHRQELGDDHLLTLRSQSYLGNVRFSEGRNREAADLLYAALAGQRRALPPDAPEIRDSLVWLDLALRVIGTAEERQEVERELSEFPGREDDPESAGAYFARAGECYAEGRDDDGMVFSLKALEIVRKERGDHDIGTLIVEGNLATRLLGMRRLEEAEVLARSMLVGSREQLGEPHPQTTNAMCILGQILREAGRYDEAETYLRRSLELRSKHLGPEDKATVQSQHHLDLLLEARAR